MAKLTLSKALLVALSATALAACGGNSSGSSSTSSQIPTTKPAVPQPVLPAHIPDSPTPPASQAAQLQSYPTSANQDVQAPTQLETSHPQEILPALENGDFALVSYPDANNEQHYLFAFKDSKIQRNSVLEKIELNDELSGIPALINPRFIKDFDSKQQNQVLDLASDDFHGTTAHPAIIDSEQPTRYNVKILLDGNKFDRTIGVSSYIQVNGNVNAFFAWNNVAERALRSLQVTEGAEVTVDESLFKDYFNRNGSLYLKSSIKQFVADSLYNAHDGKLHLDLGTTYKFLQRFDNSGTLVVHKPADTTFYLPAQDQQGTLRTLLVDATEPKTAKDAKKPFYNYVAKLDRVEARGFDDTQKTQLALSEDGKGNIYANLVVQQTPAASSTSRSLSDDAKRVAGTEALLSTVLAAADAEVASARAESGVADQALLVNANSSSALQLAASVVEEGALAGLNSEQVRVAALKTAGSVYPDLLLSATKRQLVAAHELTSLAARASGDDKIHPYLTGSFSHNSFSNDKTVVKGSDINYALSRGAYATINGFNAGVAVGLNRGEWSEALQAQPADNAADDFTTDNLDNANTGVSFADGKSELAKATNTGFSGQLYFGKAFSQGHLGLNATLTHQKSQVTRNVLNDQQVQSEFNVQIMSAGLFAGVNVWSYGYSALDVFAGADLVAVQTAAFAETTQGTAPTLLLSADKSNYDLSYAFLAGANFKHTFALARPVTLQAGLLGQYHAYQPTVQVNTAVGDATADAALDQNKLSELLASSTPTYAAFQAPWFVQADASAALQLTQNLNFALGGKVQWTQNWFTKTAYLRATVSF